MTLLFVKELEFLSFTINRNCQLNVRRWRKPESLSPVHHADISCCSECYGIQNKSFILQLSMPGVLSNNIEFCLQIIHHYVWHVLEVCKCPVCHIENHPESSHWQCIVNRVPYAANSNRWYFCVAAWGDRLCLWENQRMLSSYWDEIEGKWYWHWKAGIRESFLHSPPEGNCCLMPAFNARVGALFSCQCFVTVY